ncbi:MAG: BtpA/SgcQ family protein [Verrucomicrobiota bacterium]
MKIQKPFVIGVIHLEALPGSPGWGGDIEAVISSAARDAEAYVNGGADAMLIENFRDVPFTRGAVPPETVAAMAAVASRLRVDLPIGFNVLRNDARSGLALCAACSGSFIRVNVHSGAMITDQGLIQGEAFETLRERKRLAPGVSIFADVHVKHATPLGNPTLEDSARDTLHRGLADALVVSGRGTGAEVDLDDLKRVRTACPDATILVGSGVTMESAPKILEQADGFLVASSLKQDGRLENPVDEARVRALMDRVRS